MKKTLSLLLMLALLISLLAGLGVLAADEPAPALEICTQEEGGEAKLVKSYTAEELAALAEKAEGYAYPYMKKDAWNATVATEYVTLSALLADAGVSFGEGDKLSFICSDGPYSKGDFSYENVSARGVDLEGNPVPTGLAITWNNGSLAESTVADIAATAKNTGSLRFVSGATAAELESQNAAGNRMPSGVVTITVVSPAKPVLTVSVQEGEGQATQVKSYTAAELAALAEKAEGYAYPYMKKDAWNATVATEYVTLSALLADAGVSFGAGDKLSFICSDGPYSKGDFSYENVSARGVDLEGNPVPTGLAITWNNGSLADSTVADIAATAKNTGNLRFVSGATAAELEGKNAAGNRMPSGVVEITVVSAPKTVAPVYKTYTVKAGDTLWGIAKRELGSGFLWGELFAVNADLVKNPRMIYVGQVLNIPEK